MLHVVILYSRQCSLLFTFVFWIVSVSMKWNDIDKERKHPTLITAKVQMLRWLYSRCTLFILNSIQFQCVIFNSFYTTCIENLPSRCLICIPSFQFCVLNSFSFDQMKIYRNGKKNILPLIKLKVQMLHWLYSRCTSFTLNWIQFQCVLF